MLDMCYQDKLHAECESVHYNPTNESNSNHRNNEHSYSTMQNPICLVFFTISAAILQQYIHQKSTSNHKYNAYAGE